MRYKPLVLDTHHPVPLYLREHGCKDPWLFFETESGPRKKVWETLV